MGRERLRENAGREPIPRGAVVRGVGLAVFLVLALGACAAGANEAAGTAPDPAGFWLGLWHGLISPIAFVVSLFTERVGIYEVDNNGTWYDLGFMVGVAVAFSGTGRSAGRGRRRRRYGHGDPVDHEE